MQQKERFLPQTLHPREGSPPEAPLDACVMPMHERQIAAKDTHCRPNPTSVGWFCGIFPCLASEKWQCHVGIRLVVAFIVKASPHPLVLPVKRWGVHKVTPHMHDWARLDQTSLKNMVAFIDLAASPPGSNGRR